MKFDFEYNLAAWFCIIMLVILFAVCAVGILPTVYQAIGIQEGEVYMRDFSSAKCESATTSECQVFTVFIKDTVDGKEKKNWFAVPYVVWENIQVGDWFNKSCMCVKERGDK